MFRLVIPFIILIFPVSCRMQVNDGTDDHYFSMDSLVDSQIEQLIKLNPELHKEATLNGADEDKTLHLDSLGWENELKIFREADIDKPAFHGSYDIIKGEQDVFSNLLYDEYIPQNPENLPVKSFRVYYLHSPDVLKKIEIRIKDKNELFSTESSLSMSFDERGDLSVLSFYEVKGSQKLTLNDSVHYSMNSTLIF